MKAVVFPGDRVAEIVDLPTPDPGPGQVRMRVRVSGICGSDLHKYRDSSDARRPFRHVVTGHEPVGDVDAVGPGADQRLVGRRVVSWHVWGCLAIDGPCRAAMVPGGLFCPHAAQHGRNADGSNAEYHVAPASTMMPLPSDLSYEDGVLLACNVGTAWSALAKVDLRGDERVVVWGLGPVGLAAALVALDAGARVVGVDVSPERLGFGRRLGLAQSIDANSLASGDDVVDAIGGFADVAVDTTGQRAVQSMMPEAVRHRGQLVLVGIGPHTGLDRTNLITLRELVVRGSLVFHQDDWGSLVEFARRVEGGLASRLVSHRMPWSAAEEAFGRADAGATAKVVLDWDVAGSVKSP